MCFVMGECVVYLIQECSLVPGYVEFAIDLEYIDYVDQCFVC